ncbi:hypothetical protein HJ009_22760 [Vibrio parahaemolyticus]|nr:hypothetical protein [Vibrio parahaemolyticus]
MHVAKQMLAELGSELVGRTVITMPYGGWPGGLARVTEVNPDPAAPEISFNVQSIQTREEIGVFEDEWVFLHEELPEELKC